MLGLRFCARAFSSCGKRGPLFIVVRRPLAIAASLVAENRLQTRRLNSCGSRAQVLRGTWDLPRPGLEPVSPALAGRFSTTAPPGKPHYPSFLRGFYISASHSLLSVLFVAKLLCLRCCLLGFPELSLLRYEPGLPLPSYSRVQSHVLLWIETGDNAPISIGIQPIHRLAKAFSSVFSFFLHGRRHS